MKIKQDKEINETKRNWYDYEIESYEKLNKILLYISTMSDDFTIATKKRENKTYIGYIITEIEINDEIIEKWYDEIKQGQWEGGENNMHETTN